MSKKNHNKSKNKKKQIAATDEEIKEIVPEIKTVAGQIITPTEEEKKDNFEDGEDALEMHYMSFFQRTRYKRAQHKRKMDGMSKKEQFKFFLDYYKWNVIIIALLLICAGTFAKELYLNTRPMALGVIILNNTTLADVPEEKAQELGILSADDLSEKIETDYRNFYNFHKYDRFSIFTGLKVDIQTYLGEIVSTGTGTLTSYENLFYQTEADVIDVIITDETGINYCVEQDIVYPIDRLFDKETHALFADSARVYKSYTGDEREYAIEVTGNKYIESLGLGYTKTYLLIPSNEEDNKKRAMDFYRFLLEYK